MSIKVEIIADSINPKDIRLTSFILEYPRWIHAELLTHRVFSKNSASSRAIPIEKFIEQITTNPALPVWWGKNQSGMQAREEIDNITRHDTRLTKKYDEYQSHSLDKLLDLENSGSTLKYWYSYDLTDLEYSKILWLEARDSAIEYAQNLNKLGLHKQITNRLLEPWFHIRVILTGTEFENFFALRAHPDAQPEIRVLAEMMLEEYNKSEPKSLRPGEWHVPFGDKIDEHKIINLIEEKHGFADSGDIQKSKIKIAVARCARVSYFNFEGKDDYAADIKLCDRLFGATPKHLSPTEHVAQSLDDDKFIGNFRGFKQYRYFFPDQSLSDSRIIKKYYKR